MRVHAFRAWFVGAMNQGVGAARRAGHAMTRRIRNARGQVDAGVGVGDDENEFGGGRSRAWFEHLGEYVGRLLKLFDKSTFERFRPVESFFRRLLGLSPRAVPEPKVPKQPTKRLAAPAPIDPAEAARLRAEIRQQMIMANARGIQNLRPARGRGSSGAIAVGVANLPAPVLDASAASTDESSAAASDPSSSGSSDPSFSAPTDPHAPVAPPIPPERRVATEPGRGSADETQAAVVAMKPNNLEITAASVPVAQVEARSASDPLVRHARPLSTDLDFDLAGAAALIAGRPTEPPPAAAEDLRAVATQPIVEAFTPAEAPAENKVRFGSSDASGDFFEETDPEAHALISSETPVERS